MNFIKSLCLALLVCFIASSCGVMFGGSRYNGVILVKDHPKATISVNGKELGVGSATGSFKRNQPLSVTVEEKGCEPKTRTFDNTFRTGNFILSLISWGIAGIAIDLGTGACYKPDHRNDPKIIKQSDKGFSFIVDYNGCNTGNTLTETTN